MEMIKQFEPIALLVVVLGALNWGMVGLFDTNLVTELLDNGTAADVVYTVIGVCGVLSLPRVLEEMRSGHGMPHPRRT
jgi:uncharacterized membrane protein YuzA (DUF378 family)